MTRIDRAYRFLERVQKDVAQAIRSNLERGVDGDGNPLPGPWHDDAVFPGGMRSDRAGQPLLIDTGAMLASIRPGSVTRNGNTLVATVLGNGNVRRQHYGFRTSAPVTVPRTQAQRQRARAGDVTGIPRRDRIVLKNDAVAPPRPFVSLSAGTLTGIVARAARGL